MKKFFTVLFVLAVLSTAMFSQPVGNIQKGDVAKVPEWNWITVMNPDGIKNGNGFFRFKDQAGIDYPGTVTVIGLHDNLVLVRYQLPREVFGTSCPSGVIFFLEKKIFSEWKAGKAAKIKAEEQALKDLVKRLMNDK